MAYKNLLKLLTPISGLLVSCLLLLLCFPPFNLYGLAFISLVPLLLQLQKHPSNPFWKGLCFGTLFFGGFNAWIIPLKAFAPMFHILLLWTSYSLILGIWYGLLFWLIVRFKAYHPLLIASLWTLMEILKSFGQFGNPSGSIGYTQAYNFWWNPLLNIIGTFGLSFIIIALNAYCVLFIISSKKRTQHAISIGLLIIIPFLYGHFFRNPLSITPSIFITIVQPNISQKDKLNQKKQPQLQKELLTQLRSITSKNNLIVLPETVMTRFNLQIPSFMNAIHSILKNKSNHLIWGSSSYTPPNTYNSIIHISPDLTQQRYHKSQLMPFGEYTPYRKWIEKTPLINQFLPHDFNKGPAPAPLNVNQTPYGATICLEGAYSHIYRKLAKKKSEFFILASNSAWFFNSSAAKKLFSIAIHRAIETNRYVICASNTGQSGIITNQGKALTFPMHQKNNFSGTITPIKQITPYTRYGDTPLIIGCLLFLLVFSIKSLKQA